MHIPCWEQCDGHPLPRTVFTDATVEEETVVAGGVATFLTSDEDDDFDGACI